MTKTKMKKLVEIIKPYIKHSQSCTLDIASGDMGDFCTCNRKERREKLAQTILDSLTLDKEVIEKIFEKPNNMKVWGKDQIVEAIVKSKNVIKIKKED